MITELALNFSQQHRTVHISVVSIVAVVLIIIVIGRPAEGLQPQG
jgi:hypothetical protein